MMWYVRNFAPVLAMWRDIHTKVRGRTSLRVDSIADQSLDAICPILVEFHQLPIYPVHIVVEGGGILFLRQLHLFQA